MHDDEGFPRTAALSPRLQWVDTTDSTNADVVAAVIADADAWPHLSVLLTDDQRAGRGRRTRSWIAPPGTALAISVVVAVAQVAPARRGWIPLVAGAAMAIAAEAVAGPSRDIAVKWPNDVLLGGGKLCGILAEGVPGHPDTVVVGAGVNTRMSGPDLPVATATSFRVAGVEVDDDALVAAYLDRLDRMLRDLGRAGGDAEASGVAATVRDRCSTIGRTVRASLPDGGVLEGVARTIDAEGRLVVAMASGDHPVAAGDVVHVR